MNIIQCSQRFLFEVCSEITKKTQERTLNLSTCQAESEFRIRPDQEPNDIRAIGEGVRKVYEEVLVPAGMGDVAIYTELGRYMIGTLRLPCDKSSS